MAKCGPNISKGPSYGALEVEIISNPTVTSNVNNENSENAEDKMLYQQKLNGQNTELVAPDGGWAWMIVFGSFLNMVGSTFPIFGFGILFSPLLMSFDVSSSKIAWIFNICTMVWHVSALFIGPFQEQFGLRKIAIFGGILNAFSVVLSAVAPSPDFLFISFSILGGIAGSTAVTISFIEISKYFSKHLGFAMGITSLGFCFSSFMCPLIASYLLDNYGYMGAALIYGAIVLNQCVGGALFQPVEWHMKSVPVEHCPEAKSNLNETLNQSSSYDAISSQMIRMKRKKYNRRSSNYSVHSDNSFDQLEIDLSHYCKRTTSQDEEITEKDNLPQIKKSCFILQIIIKSTYNNLKTLKFMRVIVISIASGCLFLGYVNFQMWIPFVVTNSGYSLEMAAWCVSASSIANIIGRVVTSVLSDKKKFNIQYANMIGVLLIGLSIFAFSVVKDIKYYLIFVCLWGLGVGISLSLNTTIMISIMGAEIFPAVFGVASVANGLFGIVFGPIVGSIRDSTSSYMYALWLLGAAEMASLCLWLLMPLAVKYDRMKEDKDKAKPLRS